MPDYNSSWSTPEAFEADIRKGVAAKGEVDNLKTVARTGSYNDLTDKPTKASFGLGNVDNTSDLAKPISTATQTALNGKVNKESGKGLSTNDYTTEEKQKLAGLSNYDDSVIKAEIGAVVNSGAKNLIDLGNPRTVTTNGITFTIYSDGNVSVKGTATSLAILDLSSIDNHLMALSNGTYIISGSPKNGSGKWSVSIIEGSTRKYEDGNGIILNVTDSVKLSKMTILVNQGITIDAVFKPMLRDASIEDDSFIPYAKTNVELTNDIKRMDNNGLLNLKSRVITAGNTDETYTLTADNGKYLIFCIAHPQLLSTVAVLDATHYGQTDNEYGLNVVSGVIKLKVKAYGQCIVFWNNNKELTITKD